MLKTLNGVLRCMPDSAIKSAILLLLTVIKVNIIMVINEIN